MTRGECATRKSGMRALLQRQALAPLSFSKGSRRKCAILAGLLYDAATMAAETEVGRRKAAQLILQGPRVKVACVL
jgi:hypothetical protein